VVDASIATLNFSKVPSVRQHKSGRIRDRGDASDARPVNAEGKLLTPKQIRARARRAAKRSRSNGKALMSELEFERLYKPVDQWDLEELARGRPRDKDGTFRGRKPGWITREVHERAMELFVEQTRGEMGALTPDALDAIRWVVQNEDTDERGKLVVPAAAKNQAAMFILEHVVGKPKQRMEADISVKLQGILAGVMVNPNEALAPPEQGGGERRYELAHFPGQTIPMGADKEDLDNTIEGEWEESDDE